MATLSTMNSIQKILRSITKNLTTDEDGRTDQNRHNSWSPSAIAISRRSPDLEADCSLAPKRISDYNTLFAFMADRLYLSIWFPSFQASEMLPRLHSVIKQFPFSTQRGGIGYVAVRSISWEQPIVFEQTFDYRVDPERALALADYQTFGFESTGSKQLKKLASAKRPERLDTLLGAHPLEGIRGEFSGHRPLLSQSPFRSLSGRCPQCRRLNRRD